MTANSDPRRGRLPSAAPRLRRAFGGGFVVVMALTGVAVAQVPPASEADQFPPQARPVAEVVVPIPSEIFCSLDRFANSNWQSVQLPALSHAKPHGDQTQIALRLGAVIAEGFIAVEARDAAELKELGGAALTLARALGVERTVMRRSESIVESAERGDWVAVRREWDAVLPDVQQGMKEIRSEELSQLVSLGGWLRGSKALTGLVLQRYSVQGAELLRQPALIQYFEESLRKMGGSPRVLKMSDGLKRVSKLVVDSSQPIPENSVRNFAAVCDELLSSIETGGAK